MIPWSVLTWKVWAIIGAFIVAALIGSHTYVYFKGHHAAELECEAAALQAELDTLRRDLEIQRQAAESARTKAAELDDLRTSLSEKVQTYEKRLIARASPACRLTRDDIEFLRSE